MRYFAEWLLSRAEPTSKPIKTSRNAMRSNLPNLVLTIRLKTWLDYYWQKILSLELVSVASTRSRAILISKELTGLLLDRARYHTTHRSSDGQPAYKRPICLIASPLRITGSLCFRSKVHQSAKRQVPWWAHWHLRAVTARSPQPTSVARLQQTHTSRRKRWSNQLLQRLKKSQRMTVTRYWCVEIFARKVLYSITREMWQLVAMVFWATITSVNQEFAKDLLIWNLTRYSLCASPIAGRTQAPLLTQHSSDLHQAWMMSSGSACQIAKTSSSVPARYHLAAALTLVSKNGSACFASSARKCE